MKRLYTLIMLTAVLFAACVPRGTGAECTLHPDNDENGYCDICGTPTVVTLNFYCVNDLHGKICDTDTQPGVDELTSYLKNAEEKRGNTVVLSAGDMWQGSSESNMTGGLLTTEWMNGANFEAMALGNHEFDWGEEAIEENLAIAEFPFLAINVYRKDTQGLAPYCTPSVMINRGPVNIGIIGAVGDCYSSIASDMTENLYFKVGSELTELVKKESVRLRGLGADIIVYLLHDGNGSDRYGDVSDGALSPYYDISLSDGFVDLVFEGHTHQRYVQVDSKGVYHLQGGGDNKGISHAQVDVNYGCGKVVGVKANYLSTASYTHFEDDPLIASLVEKYGVSEFTSVIGQNAHERSRDELRQIAAELYYEYGSEKWGRDYEIALAGAFFTVRSPGFLDSGDVTYSMLCTLFPFDNEIMLCSISGRDLKDKFFESSNSNYFIAYGDYGESIRDSIDESATYYVVTDSYTSTYAPNRMTEIESYDSKTFLRDLLAEYIKQGKME